jgi:hypothetical protein
MQWRYIWLLTGIFFVQCSKKNITSKPKLVLSNDYKTLLKKNDHLTFNFTITDAEGDIDTLYTVRKTYICSASPDDLITDINYPLPDYNPFTNFEANMQVDLIFDPSGTSGAKTIKTCNSGGRFINDSSYFLIWAKDKANNISDTIITNNIVFKVD